MGLCSALLALTYWAVDLMLCVLLLMVCYGKTGMLTTVLTIIDENSDPATQLLAKCPSWTIQNSEQLRSLDWTQFLVLGILTIKVSLFFGAALSFALSITGGMCPRTPKIVAHRLAMMSLFVSGTALLFCINGFALEWKTDGNPFHPGTSPRDIDSDYYYSSVCSGYGGCSGSYSDVVALHDDWCPTGVSPLLAESGSLASAGLIAFGVELVSLLACLVRGCHTGWKGRVVITYLLAAPAILAALFGLVIGGIQYPVSMIYILAHAIWQYMRIPINLLVGVDQNKVDTDFKQPSDDVVPGVIGAMVGDGDGGDGSVADDSGYMGY
ncbi:unnamed protein product [Effrenium voratum]|nr:unnamed protein product [Effrenium voratum]